MGRTSELQLLAASEKVDLRHRQNRSFSTGQTVRSPSITETRSAMDCSCAGHSSRFVIVGPRGWAGLEIRLRSRVNSDDVGAPGRSFRRGALE